TRCRAASIWTARRSNRIPAISLSTVLLRKRERQLEGQTPQQNRRRYRRDLLSAGHHLFSLLDLSEDAVSSPDDRDFDFGRLLRYCDHSLPSIPCLLVVLV